MKIYTLRKRQHDGKDQIIYTFHDKNKAEETLEHLQKWHDIRRQEYYYLDELDVEEEYKLDDEEEVLD